MAGLGVIRSCRHEVENNSMYWCMTENTRKLHSTLTPSGLYNRKQIADYIGVSERTISNMMRTRRIPVIRIGGNVRFDPVKVRKALEKYEIEAI